MTPMEILDELSGKIAVNIEELRKITEMNLPEAVQKMAAARHSKIDAALQDAKRAMHKSLTRQMVLEEAELRRKVTEQAQAHDREIDVRP